MAKLQFLATFYNCDLHLNVRSSCSRDEEEGDHGAAADDGDGLVSNPPPSVMQHRWRPWGEKSRSVMLCFCDITPFKTLRTWLRLIIMVRWCRKTEGNNEMDACMIDG